MDHGLSENFTDRVSPIKPHIDHLEALGVQSGPLNPHVNSVTSDVVKACTVPYCSYILGGVTPIPSA